ncbi:hypothetical protein ABZ901_16245 [Actinacidiphila alni]|uniref:hypothetical protein n=1 Tax=Actinacidiphila alni TaxID=380248 RepID=UPI0033F26F16
MLVVCMQCGAMARCLECFPYSRPSEIEEEHAELVRLIRDHPKIGLFAGAVSALVPGMLLWAGTVFVPPGVVRAAESVAGAVAVCAFLVAGAAAGWLPLLGEVPQCRRGDWTPYDRWALIGVCALVVQAGLVCAGISVA